MKENDYTITGPYRREWHTSLWFAFGCFAVAVAVLVAVSLEWI